MSRTISIGTFFFGFIYRLPFESSGTASCGTTGIASLPFLGGRGCGASCLNLHWPSLRPPLFHLIQNALECTSSSPLRRQELRHGHYQLGSLLLYHGWTLIVPDQGVYGQHQVTRNLYECFSDPSWARSY